MAGKDKKKGKPSKAEKEKQKKEEAERKAQEEEEARLLAEQEEREREEKERQEREERRQLEEQERVRHQAEIDELNKEFEANQQYLLELRHSINEKNKWNRYMLCDGRPDPTCKKAINTFIHLTRDDLNALDFGKVLKKCKLILQLIKELEENIEELLLNIKEENNEDTQNVIQSYEESKEDLQQLILLKIDEATLNLLKSPGENIDSDTLNIQTVEQYQPIKLCLWGNAATNPRVKQIEFEKDAFTMELPKQMALAAIAVRVLYVDFDFLSPKCSTYLYKAKGKGDEGTDIEKEQNNENEEKEEGKTISASPAPSTRTFLSVKESAKSTKSRTGTAASVSSMRKDSSGPSPEQSSSSVGDAAKNINIDKTIDEEDLLDEDIVDLRSFSPIGSLIYIELLELPPQAKEIDGWVIQHVVSGNLQKIPYGEEDHHSITSLDQSVTSVVSSKESGVTTSSLSYSLPLAFSIKVDEKVMVCETPQIARWDVSSQHWKLDGITDFRYEEDERLCFFRSAHFGQFAIMQDIYLNMPFQSWQLRPTALNRCLITIIGAAVEVEITIEDDKCCVNFPTEMKHLEYLVNQWMKPAQLIKALRAAGVNIFPYEDGHKYVSVCQKVNSLVPPLYQQIALSASCFAYAWSKWNNECGEEKVVVQATEWIEAGVPPEEKYNLYMSSTRICCQLKLNEYADEFSTYVFPESQMHPDLYHMLRDGASDTAKQRLKDSSVVFIDCVHQLVSSANIFVYA